MIIEVSESGRVFTLNPGSAVFFQSRSALALERFDAELRGTRNKWTEEGSNLTLTIGTYSSELDPKSHTRLNETVGELLGLAELLARCYAQFGESVCPQCSAPIKRTVPEALSQQVGHLFRGKVASFANLDTGEVLDRFAVNDQPEAKVRELYHTAHELGVSRGRVRELNGGDDAEILIAFDRSCLACGHRSEEMLVADCLAFLQGTGGKRVEIARSLTVDGISLVDRKVQDIESVTLFLMQYGVSKLLSSAPEFFRSLAISELPFGTQYGDLISDVQERVILALGVLSGVRGRVFSFKNIYDGAKPELCDALSRHINSLKDNGNAVILFAPTLPDGAPFDASFTVPTLSSVCSRQDEQNPPRSLVYSLPEGVEPTEDNVRAYAQAKPEAKIRYAQYETAPIGKSLLSYFEILPDLATHYAYLPEAQLHKVNRKDFLRGEGEGIKGIRYRGYSLLDILAGDINLYCSVFSNHPKHRRLCERLNTEMLSFLPLAQDLCDIPTAQWRLLSLIKESLTAQEGEIVCMVRPAAGMGGWEVESGLQHLTRILASRGIRVVLADIASDLLESKGTAA